MLNKKCIRSEIDRGRMGQIGTERIIIMYVCLSFALSLSLRARILRIIAKFAMEKPT